MRYRKTGGWLGYAVIVTIIAVQTTVVVILKDSASNANTNTRRILADSVVTPDSLPLASPTEAPLDAVASPPAGQARASQETESRPESEAATLKESCESVLTHFTVRITDQASNGKKEIGSGILINGTDILTAFHVVKLQGKIRVEFADGNSADATYIRSDRVHDLALIRLAEDPSKFTQPIEIATSTPSSDENICAVGSPFGAPLRGTVGKVLTVNERGEVLITAGLLYPGDSGGPLINTDGTLVGLNRAVLRVKDKSQKSELQDGTGVAISPESIRAFLDNS